MPINIPNLDDRNYDQFYNEAMSVITRYYPDYAGMGLSDPVMVLAELFSYYFDVTSYQIDQISPQTWRNFATMIGVQGENARPEELIRAALAELSSVKRAVTADDIETIIKRESINVARVGVFPGDRLRIRVVAERKTDETEEELSRIYSLLRRCGPLCTRYDVQYAPVLGFEITAEVIKTRAMTLSDKSLSDTVKNKLNDFFSPLKGGGGRGWEFGRAISRSEIFSLIEGVAGVDYVASIKINRSGKTYVGDDELPLKQDELVQLDKTNITIL